ncbi:MAG: C25 family cysteine peptidase [Thermoplasmata archaeon]
MISCPKCRALHALAICGLILIPAPIFFTGASSKSIPQCPSASPSTPPFPPCTVDAEANSSREAALLSPEGGTSPRGTGSLIYAILCPARFKDELVPLKNWKTKKGMNAEIFTLEEMLSAYTGKPGVPTFAKVHQFLRNLYRTNPELKWVLVVGDGDADSETFPVPYIFTNASHDDRMGDESILDYVPSDVMYSGLNYDWDTDGDGLYGEFGEEDWVPEVYVGRWPCKYEGEVTINVNRLLTYERNPPIGDWMRSALFAGALYDIPNIVNPDPNQWVENMYEWTHDNGRTPILQAAAQFPSYMNKKMLFDYNETYGGRYTKENDTLDEVAFRAEMNAGYALVTTASHGWISGNGINHYFGNGSDPQLPVYSKFKSFYFWTDARDASNGDRLPLMYSSGCDVANFTTFWHYTVGENRDKTLEQLLKNAGGGAIGFISGTNGDYWNPTDGNWWLQVTFWRLFFNGSYRPGEALYKSKVEYDNFLRSQMINTGLPRYRQNKAVYCLLGDPEVPVWTDIPSTLQVTVESPPRLLTLPQTVNVTVRDASTMTPVKNAMVALTSRGTFARGFTDVSGRASVLVEPEDPGYINLTVTAHNYLPHESTLDVELAPADLSVTPANIRVISSGPVVGEGEEVTIMANISNLGRLPAEEVLVRFYDGEPGSGVEIASRTIPSIPPRERAAAEARWTATGGFHRLYVWADPLNTVTEYDEENNLASIELLVAALDLTVTPENIRVSPAVMLRGELTAANGSTLTINVTILNRGGGSVEGVYVRLLDGERDGGLPIEGDKRIDIIPGGGSGSAEFLWSDTSAGRHTLTAIVDPLGKLVEFDESNNEASISLRLDAPPGFYRPLDPAFIDEDRGQSIAFDLHDYVTDPDTDPSELVFSLVEITRPEANVTVTPQGLVGYRPLPDWNGVAIVTVAVSDGVSEARASFELTVRPVNDPPRIEPVPDVELEEGDYFHCVVNASDVDIGDILTFSDDTPLFEINSSTGKISFTPKRSDVGRHTITITVKDLGGLSDFFVWKVTIVKRNHPPQLLLGPEVVIRGVERRPVIFRFNASDPDGDPLTFSDDCPFLDVDPLTGELNFTPSRGSAGNYSFNITVRDTGGLSDSRPVALVIDPAPAVHLNGETRPAVEMVLTVSAILTILVLVAVSAILSRRRARIALKTVERERYERIYGDGSYAATRHVSGRVAPLPRKEEEGQAPGGAEGKSGPRCPKCGSDRVQLFEDGGGICNICGKVIKK